MFKVQVEYLSGSIWGLGHKIYFISGSGHGKRLQGWGEKKNLPLFIYFLVFWTAYKFGSMVFSREVSHNLGYLFTYFQCSYLLCLNIWRVLPYLHNSPVNFQVTDLEHYPRSILLPFNISFLVSCSSVLYFKGTLLQILNVHKCCVCVFIWV